MNREFKISTLVLIVFIAFLWLEKPTREILSYHQVDELVSKFVSGLIIRLVLIVGAIVLMIKWKLTEFAGLTSLGEVIEIRQRNYPPKIVY